MPQGLRGEDGLVEFHFCNYKEISPLGSRIKVGPINDFNK